jgi:hypothetical protein
MDPWEECVHVKAIFSRGSCVPQQRTREVYFRNLASLSLCCSVSVGMQRAHCCNAEGEK